MTFRSTGPAVPGVDRAGLASFGDRREDGRPVAARQRPDDLFERLAGSGRRRSLELENLRGACAEWTRDIRQQYGQALFVLALQGVTGAKPHHEVHEDLP